jgi:hypothetical protein
MVKLGIPHVLFQAPGIDRNSRFTVTADGNRFVLDVDDSKESSEPLTLVQNWTADLRK